VKRKTKEWKKIFENDMPNLGLVSRIHKNHLHSIVRRKLNLKMGKGFE
jgi:hypothetical protein